MILVIAEKPSVARDIGKILKCNKKSDGYIYGDKYIVTWAVGHLVTLFEPDEYDPKYKKWRADHLPIIPDEIKLKAITKVKKQYKIIEKLVKSEKVESLICATDSGREGELIFRYIYDKIGVNKPFERLWISSMTDEAITAGFNSLKSGEEYDNLYNSARSRSEADWLVGMNASRIFTLKYNALLPIGRVQTPTLALIVERDLDIEDFVPKDYYEVKIDLDGFMAIWTKDKETKILDKDKAYVIKEKVKGKDAKVKEVNKDLKKVNHPLLYDLTELQRDANKKFGFTANQTLKIAQELYEKRKLITYPRTDSRYLTDDMKSVVKSTIEKLKVNEYAEYINKISDIKFTKRIIDNKKVSDHHAIIPTNKKPNIESLSPDERKIYDIVARKFICVFYPKYEYESTKIVFDVENEQFVSRGTVIKKMGWKEVFSDNKASKDEVLPDLKSDDVRNIKDAIVESKKTKPQPRYNEALLLDSMEHAGKFVDEEELKDALKEGGLGTPATRASIIERLISVGYIKREKKNILSTEKGRKLIKVVPKELKTPETTGKWEKGLSLIAKGEMDRERFMNSIKRYVVFLVNQSPKLDRSVKFENKYSKKIDGLGKCPICDGRILENKKAFYCTNWRNECKYSIWKDEYKKYGLELDESKVKQLLSGKNIESINIHMPQTNEKATADLVIENGKVMFKNLKRVE